MWPAEKSLDVGPMAKISSCTEGTSQLHVNGWVLSPACPRNLGMDHLAPTNPGVSH